MPAFKEREMCSYSSKVDFNCMLPPEISIIRGHHPMGGRNQVEIKITRVSSFCGCVA